MKNKPDMLINGTRSFIINHSFIIKMTTKSEMRYECGDYLIL